MVGVKMTIIQINEENHGTIGAAISIKEAVKWLIESGWLWGTEDYDGKYNKETEKWEYTSPIERYGESWKEVLPERPENEIKEFLDGVFYFNKMELH
jgi:hypothetical protein